MKNPPKKTLSFAKTVIVPLSEQQANKIVGGATSKTSKKTQGTKIQ